MNKERILLGINGLDEMMGGGLIKESICTIIGTYGTGKTTFALEFLYEGLKNDESGVFISLEEDADIIYEKIEDRGYDIAPYRDKSFFVLKLDPTDFNISINSIKNELPDLIKSVNAKRVVIDPISLFEGLFDDEALRRKEMFRLFEMLRRLDCTYMMTTESEKGDFFSSKYGLVEYLADTVVILRYIRPSDLSEVHTAVEVVKMRRSNHSREIKPYEIMEDKVNVYSEAGIF